MADGPKFGKYVRSKPGHVVQRYGSLELIGATRRPLTKSQKVDGEAAVEWNDSIVPLTIDYCRRYARELDGHIAAGELELCTREQWEAQCAAAQKIADEDTKRAAKRAADEAKKGTKE
jgi:hypothetical protein